MVIMVDLNEFHPLGKNHFSVIKLGSFHAADLIGIRLLTDEAKCNQRLLSSMKFCHRP